MNTHKDKIMLYKWRCLDCKGGLEVVNIAMDFQQCIVSVLADCLQCGKPQAFTMDFTDFVNISREFWMSYYKRLPPPKEGNNEK